MLKELQRLCKLMNIPVLRDAPDCQAAVSVYRWECHSSELHEKGSGGC